MFTTLPEIEALLAAGKTLVVAGNEDMLRRLPRGNWIGGTIPYFMTEAGGVTSRNKLYVDQIPSLAQSCEIRSYDQLDIERIATHSPERGYTVLIIPAFSALHQHYALNAAEFPELFFRVIAGWIAGVHLDDLGSLKPTVFNGATGEASSTKAVALHITLPATHSAALGIVNIFEQGDAAEITFPRSGFSAGDCFVDGERQNFHDYIVANQLDSRLPLVANFCGAKINVSIQALDPKTHSVQFYAPVFEDVKYRMAKPIENYSARFAAAIPSQIQSPAFSCNCVLNYLYGGLEGGHTGAITGPMTFGEIGYQLLNQTLVYVTIAAQ